MKTKETKSNNSGLLKCIVGTYTLIMIVYYYHDDALFVEKYPYRAWSIMLVCGVLLNRIQADKEPADFIHPARHTLLELIANLIH